MKILRRCWKTVYVACIAVFTFGLVSSARADLLSSKSWSSWSGTFNSGGHSWTADNSSPSWLISDPSGYTSWLFSLNGTTGDFDFILLPASSASSTTPDLSGGLLEVGIGIFLWPLDRQSIINAFPSSDHAYFVVLARRTSGGTAIGTPTGHGVGSSLTLSHIFTFANDGSTFYLGTDSSAFDGIGSFVGKCNSGTWVSMGFGVDCATCLNPQVDLVVVISSSVVKVEGVFDFGYNATAPYEVDATDIGSGKHRIYWHNTSSIAGYWSTSP